jgi:two-component system NtrC family sensor kinase
VLVVDDRPASRYAIVHTLKRAGYEVIEANTGRDALELAKQIPAAILLDVKLPDILGYEVCRRLKSNPSTSHIPILQLSAAFMDNESRVYALESGADAYLTQPVEPNVLLATLKSLIKVHEAEALAKLSAKQWQATFDALSEGVAVLDEAGYIQRCNRAMTNLLGLPHSEIENKLLVALLNESLKVNLTNIEFSGNRELKSGGRFFRARLEPVYVADDPNGSIFVLDDISQEKLAERAALQNERLAATGRMAHTIAHEINNPLAAITNLLFLLKTAPAGSETSLSYLSAAEEELARVSRIARQILSFNRDTSKPVELKLFEILDDVLALNNRLIEDKDLMVVRVWDKEAKVTGFPAQLRQVFSNILRNGVEASPQSGTLRIKISRCKLYRLPEEPGVRVTIADQGSGITEENQRRIFDAFFTTKELKGSGVGLWLSSSIVHEHRGGIQVMSRTGPGASGTCMSVYLPENQV